MKNTLFILIILLSNISICQNFNPNNKEKDTIQIKKIALKIEGKTIHDMDNIDVLKLKNIKADIKFKSKSNSQNIELQFIVFPIGGNILVFSENIETLKDLNILEKIAIGNIPQNKISNIQLQILINGKAYYSLRVITRGELTAVDYFEDFKSYASTGDSEMSEFSIENAILRDSLNIEYQNAKGQFYYEIKEYQKALTQLKKTIKIAPNYNSYKYLGYLHIELKQEDIAIQHFTNALNFTTNNFELFEIYKTIGEIKRNQQDNVAAYFYLSKALEYNPRDIPTLNNLSTVCEAANKGEEKLNYLYKILEIDSTYFLAHINIGFHYLEQQEYKEAMDEFDIVLKNDPTQPYALSNKAYCQLKLGELNEGLITINKSILYNPSNSYAYRNRALIEIELKEFTSVCNDLLLANQLGFSSQFGEEVNELIAKHCLSKK
jgi:tetratricopeptide (TPR) repeat protein